MPTYVALLRGINVGGNTKVEMVKLKACFEQLGFSHVRTYINSGNVVFEANQPEGKLIKLIEKAIKDTFGFDLTVVIRSLAEIKHVVSKIPQEWVNDQVMKTDVIFLRPEIDNKAILQKVSIKPEIETVLYLPGALVWNIDRKNVTRGSGVKLIKSAIYPLMTVRNVNTVRKLNQLMQGSSQ